MKFRVERDVLAEAVTWTARSLSPRPPVPVLSGLLIRAESGSLSIASFDYEISARLQIAADIAEEGTILVSGRLLAEICRSLPSAPVEVETDGSKVTLTCRNSRFNLATMPVAEYPELPALPEVSGVVDGEAFAQAVSQVIIAASRDDTLPILTGVRMEIEDDLITFLATDRYRLALRELSWKPATPGISTSALVKAKTLNEVAKTLGGGGDLNIAFSDDSELIGFESGGRRTTSLLVDGDYPKIRSLFPDNTPIHATVETSALVEAVRRVSLVAERNTPVRLAFTDGQVTLDAGTGEDAQASEALEASLIGDDITVAFNPHYLSEGLGAFPSKYVRFSFTTPPKPAVISAQEELTGDDQEDYRYLLMPVRLPNQ
ncbi:DNA polymerase III subunit beta [Arthrobacter sp. zg-Y820]|uniref:DNA polymerase III subunit beta n=1 Tax=unclassified Arthrobacter TaxID=235627 RepID=UPI0025401134|nr:MULTISPECIES: DNA polymerase III subunit beta [unclassified Arthrobacter]MCC9197371.1 DNA polymerase III subunit beta [Arthrobacter sp. zg-Y820]MDK1280237.1 DNA polymerase III subunit beta [Arthrobacter sp. zg.Y820]MDK1360626.1 DNA polymerase III subunit beta [Arthrobacter sp. zg-Y1219]WIB09528.1 DNA polymerase III subunit beta [Arthrobacter sp. zg-Y820]